MLVREIRHLLHARLLIDSGRLTGAELDYGRFQRQVYPGIKATFGETGKKDDTLVGQHPYVIYQALINTRRFSRAELIAALEALAEMDLGFKSTARDPERALERFVVGFCA